MPDLLGNLSAGTVGNIIAVVGVAGLDKFERDLQKMATAVDGQAQFLNKSLTAVATAGAMVFVSSIAAATEFQSSFAGVTKTVDGLSDNFGNLTGEGQRLADQFRALAREIPVPVNELARIGELAGQLGVRKDDIIEFTRTIAALGVTTNLSFEEGATQIARFINVTKQVVPAGTSMADQASRIGSAIVELGNNMATTEAEISAFGLRIAGAGAQIGLTQDQILAFGAALSSVGIQSEMGGTAISKLFIDMAKAVSDGGTQLERMAKIAGMTIPEFSRLFKEDAASAINAFFVGLNETQKSGESLFPILEEMGYKEVRLRETILKTASASDILTKALGWSSKAYLENTAMADEAQKRYSTFESQMILLKNQFQDVQIEIGNRFLPVLNAALGAVNSNNVALSAVTDSLGSLLLVFGAAAIAFKTYQAGAALVNAANVAMGGSFTATAGPIGVLVVALSALMAIYEHTEKQIREHYKAIGEGVKEVGVLESEYKALTEKMQLTADEQARLNEVTNKLNESYKASGISVFDLSKNFGQLGDQIREIKLAELQNELVDLNEELRVATSYPVLNFLGLGDKEGTEMRIAEVSNLIAQLTKEQKELASATQSMIEPAKEQVDWMKQIEDAGYSTERSIQAQIDKLEKLMEHAKPGSSPYLQIKKDLEDLYESLGKHAPWDPASNGMAGFKEIVAGTSGELSKLRVNYEDYFKIQEDYADKWDVMADAGIESSDALQKQIDKLEFLKGSYPLTAYEMDQVNEKLKQLRGETDISNNAWATYADYLNNITSRFGEFGGRVGEIGGIVGEGVNILATLKTGAFDPITLGINAAGFAVDLLGTGFGLFKDKAEPIPKTIEEVEASLGSLQTRIEETNEVIGGVGDDSSYILHLQKVIEEYKEDMKTATGSYYGLLASNIEQFQQILEDLTFAFKFGNVFDEATGNLDILLEKARYYSEYFGNIEMSGFAELLRREIDEALKLIDTIDPTSAAYADLIDKIREAYNWYGQLAGQTNLLTDIYPGFADALARIYEASFLNNEALGDESVMLERLRTSRLLYATSVEEQITIYEKLLPMLQIGSAEYEAISTLLDILKSDYDDLGDSIGETAIEFERFQFALDAALSSLRGEFDTFEAGVKFIQDALSEIEYFKFDVDTTDLDEKIAASLAQMYQYIQTLNPNSQAFLDAQAAFDELTSSFYELGYTWSDIASLLGMDSPELLTPQTLTFGLDIAAAQTAIQQIAQEIVTMSDQVESDPVQIGADIENAQSQVDNLDQQIRALFDSWDGQNIEIGVVVAGVDVNRISGGQEQTQMQPNVQIFNANPETWARITDDAIEPRLNERERSYQIAGNPYAG